MSANSVVLPAPFGPISPVMRPSGAVSDTPFTANKPPKRRDTRSTAKSGSVMPGLRKCGGTHPSVAPLRKPADQPAWREPDNQHQCAPIDDQIEPGRVAAGDRLCALAEPAHDQCAE